MKSYLIIGNGVAGITAAEHIRNLDDTGEITVVTDETHNFYSRIRLNEYLSRSISKSQLIIKKKQWYESRRIQVMLNTRITEGDSRKSMVISNDGQRFFYTRLLIATGSHSFIPPIRGAHLNGIFSLKNFDDANQILRYSRKVNDVVVIGGGLLGLEAGNALRLDGKKVTVVEFFPRLLPRQLDEQGTDRLKQIMSTMGISFRLGAKTREIHGDNAVSCVELDTGERLPAQMVIISAGVRPNIDLAAPLNLDTGKGIRVNEYLQTSQPGIYAAGDVAEFLATMYGIWRAAMEQGKTAGINMAGDPTPYHGTTMANTLKVAGVDLGTAGNIDAEHQFESTIRSDNQMYKKFVIHDNRLIGCIMIGDITGFNRIVNAISEKADASVIMNQL
ncbi:MAG: FAD-dependent oxidoreductase [Desulfobacterales bacterium]|nr:FAD-dependent oxidoreductase [Desulfobacterales bacterium]MDD4073447.1 FAD-dependent oxidoreductase [Desulfobacterales bacterium]MDD4414668.1 FAD-dependent oxidoreductase [Oscillospiraceae bacterium]